MKLPLFPLFTLAVLLAGPARAANVYILHDAATPQAAYAARKISDTLISQGHHVLPNRAGYDHLISLAINSEQLAPEAFSIIPEDKVITIYGGDDRGMIYGALALAETLANGSPLTEISATTAAPHQSFRGIKFNLPWDSYRPSSALDQHADTVKDLEFWTAFLDMMVANRFNAISLWNIHPYSYMIRPRNFPEASPWSDAEFAEWQHLYREIFRLASPSPTLTAWPRTISIRITTVLVTPRKSSDATSAKVLRRCWRSIPISTASASPTAKAWAA